jgi:hypothetical protein
VEPPHRVAQAIRFVRKAGCGFPCGLHSRILTLKLGRTRPFAICARRFVRDRATGTLLSVFIDRLRPRASPGEAWGHGTNSVV